MVDSGFQTPTNRVVERGTPFVIEAEVETATNMYAGRLVMGGTTAAEVVVCDGATKPAVGWLGWEDTAGEYRPATVDTIYVTSDKIAVVNGPGILIVGHLASGQNIDKGTRLMAAANGELSGATVGTHEVVAIAEESKNAAASPWACDIIVRSLI